MERPIDFNRPSYMGGGRINPEMMGTDRALADNLGGLLNFDIGGPANMGGPGAPRVSQQQPSQGLMSIAPQFFDLPTGNLQPANTNFSGLLDFNAQANQLAGPAPDVSGMFSQSPSMGLMRYLMGGGQDAGQEPVGMISPYDPINSGLFGGMY